MNDNHWLCASRLVAAAYDVHRDYRDGLVPPKSLIKTAGKTHKHSYLLCLARRPSPGQINNEQSDQTSAQTNPSDAYHQRLGERRPLQ